MDIIITAASWQEKIDQRTGENWKTEFTYSDCKVKRCKILKISKISRYFMKLYFKGCFQNVFKNASKMIGIKCYYMKLKLSKIISVLKI